jgi:hypothetical protein
MLGDGVTHKMQLLGWEKNGEYFLKFSPYALNGFEIKARIASLLHSGIWAS